MIFTKPIKHKNNMATTFLDEAKIRKGLNSPKFFQKLSKIGSIIGYAAGSLSAIALGLTGAGIVIPVVIITALGGISALGITIKKVSDLTVDDKDKKTLNEALKTDI